MAFRIVLAVVVAVSAVSMASAGETGIARLKAVAPTQVKLADSFWAPRLEVNRTVTLRDRR